MTTEVRQRNTDMAELKADIKTLQKSTKETQELIVEHIATNTKAHESMQQMLSDHDMVIFGNKKLGVEGIQEKLERHENTIAVVDRVFSNAKLLYTVLGVMGISTLKDLFDIAKPYLQVLLQKVSAN